MSSQKESIKSAVRFLAKVYDGSITDIALIYNSEADHEYGVILQYLDEVSGFIEKTKEGILHGDRN